MDLLQLEGVTGDAVAKRGKYLGTLTRTVVTGSTQPLNRIAPKQSCTDFSTSNH